VSPTTSRLAVAAGLALMAGGVVALAASHPPRSSVPPAVVAADAALVLSGDVDYLRVARAAELFREGAVPVVVITGKGVGGDSAEALREQCVRRGVPPDRVVLEPDSTSTRENMLFAAPLVRGRGFRRVALVTSAFHMGRAERAARRVMPEVEWVPIPVKDAGPPSHQRRLCLLEWVKLAWYLARGWA
jgi:uncharacterized SAM-binding protein YcdF (DUF218 family)